MNLAVSSIGWTNEEEQAVAEYLQSAGVKHVELAPTKLWDDPTKATDEQIAEVMDFWKKYGIEIVAFQSMLFGRENLKLFTDEATRAQTLQYLKDFVVLAGKMGAKVLVFGSPKNRQRGDMPYEDAFAIAKDFFAELGDTAQANNTCFCIEPNATDYACDFVTTAQEGIDLVKAVNNPGFGLHLDIACMTMAKDPIAQSITNAKDFIKHFHISSPFLGLVEEAAGVKHDEAAQALRDSDYEGFVSIEMRPGDAGQNVEQVKTAVTLAQKYYGV